MDGVLVEVARDAELVRGGRLGGVRGGVVERTEARGGDRRPAAAGDGRERGELGDLGAQGGVAIGEDGRAEADGDGLAVCLRDAEEGGGGDDVDVVVEDGGEGVGGGADEGLVGARVAVDFVLGAEEHVSLGDGDGGKGEPVAAGGGADGVGGDAVVGEPRGDDVGRVGVGRDEAGDVLWAKMCAVATRMG